MRGLTGSPDVTLCEFLLTVESNSELAEYCTLYLGNSPAVRGAGRRVGGAGAVLDALKAACTGMLPCPVHLRCPASSRPSKLSMPTPTTTCLPSLSRSPASPLSS